MVFFCLSLVVGVKGGGKGMYRRVCTTRMKNLDGIKSGGGGGHHHRFLSSFIVSGGVAVGKGKHFCFPLWCVIYCDNIILRRLLLKSK